MTRLMIWCVLLSAMALIAPVGSAQAQFGVVIFVSNSGDDTHDCQSPATACRTFTGALTKVQNDGEIVCVGPGPFQGGLAISITKSVTIDCAGATGVSLFSLAISGAGIVVRLRNLSINGEGFGAVGIEGLNMAALYIENCVITNFNAVNSTGSPYIGIRFRPSTPGAQLFVTNTIISNNGFLGQSAGGGIQVAPQSGGSAGVTLDRVKVQGNVTGIALNGGSGPINAVMRDSEVSGNFLNGILSLGSQPVSLSIKNSIITRNVQAGVVSQGAASTVTISGSMITGNATGVSSQSGGALQSFQNNEIYGNGTDGTLAAVGFK